MKTHINSKRISLDALPPSLVRMLARRDHEIEQERDARALDERWPMSLDVRSVVVQLALEHAGLEVRAEGTVAPIKPTEEKPLPPPRIRLSAMRVLATCDRLALEQHKFERAENPSSPDDDEPLTPGAILQTLKMTSKVGGQVLDLMGELLSGPRPRPAQPMPEPAEAHPEPAPAPEPPAVPAEASSETLVPTVSAGMPSPTLSVAEPRTGDRNGAEDAERPGRHSHAERENARSDARLGRDRLPHSPCDRWPITRQMRVQIIQSALSLCGYAMTSEGRLEAIALTEGMPKPKRRIVLGAQRILTRFDRLSMMEKKLKRQLKLKPRDAWKKKKEPAPGLTWEFLGKVCDLIEADERDQAIPGYEERCRAAVEAERIAKGYPVSWWEKKREG